MATVTSKSIPTEIAGPFPKKGDAVPGFTLVGKGMKDVSLSESAGKRIALSLDTRVCAISAREFNEQAASLVPLSTIRGRRFMRDYGVEIASGPAVGLCARAVVVLDENDTVLHAELVPETSDEPDYAAAIAALK